LPSSTPDIDHEHLTIDIGSARLAVTSERFDVVLAPNLYGEILSDVVAQVTGSGFVALELMRVRGAASAARPVGGLALRLPAGTRT